MKVDCREHRKTMQLLGLRLLLEKGKPSPEKQKEIKKRISLLEKELKLD